MGDVRGSIAPPALRGDGLLIAAAKRVEKPLKPATRFAKLTRNFASFRKAFFRPLV